MTRFLRYAVEHDRKIRAVFLLDGQMLQKTVSVVSYDGETVALRVGSKKNACGFASGGSAQLRLCPGRPRRRITGG